MKGPVIDADGHVLMECVPNWTSFFSKEDGEDMESNLLSHRGHHTDRPGSSREQIYETLRGRNKGAGGWDSKVRLEHMDDEGIDIAVLFGTEMTLNREFYTPSVCRGYNDWLADFCSADPERLKGVALLPLGDMDAAVKELDRAVGELGFVTFFMKNSHEDKSADSEHFFPLYEAAEGMNVPLSVHIPHGAKKIIADTYHYDYVKGHAIHPFSSMLSVMDVLYGGVMDRFEKLRIGFMEGQVGWIPWWLWRLDEQLEEFGTRPGLELGLKKQPSEYIEEGRLFFSCDPEEKYLAFAANTRVADNTTCEDYILWASDYPHSDGIFPGAVTTFLDQEELTEQQKDKILRDNPRAFLYGER